MSRYKGKGGRHEPVPTEDQSTSEQGMRIYHDPVTDNIQVSFHADFSLCQVVN